MNDRILSSIHRLCGVQSNQCMDFVQWSRWVPIRSFSQQLTEDSELLTLPVLEALQQEEDQSSLSRRFLCSTPVTHDKNICCTLMQFIFQ